MYLIYCRSSIALWIDYTEKRGNSDPSAWKGARLWETHAEIRAAEAAIDAHYRKAAEGDSRG
jgi:hypothetical protein